jgi:hypothetical protein
MLHPSSATFWDLMDRWDVSRRPIGDRASGSRPSRPVWWRLFLEVDTALATAGLDPSWLHKRSGTGTRSPLDLMRAGAMDEVLRSLTQAALLASVQKKAR